MYMRPVALGRIEMPAPRVLKVIIQGVSLKAENVIVTVQKVPVKQLKNSLSEITRLKNILRLISKKLSGILVSTVIMISRGLRSASHPLK